jgi:cytoskeletal protein CcmA (bactofilin family)
VSGDILIAGGSLTLESGGTVDGDILVGGGDVELLGNVGGEVRGSTQSLTIGGTIDGDVDVSVSDLDLLSTARINGDLDYASRKDASIASGAVVRGETTRSEPSSYYPGDNLGSWLSSALFRLLCGLVAGLILVLVVPRFLIPVADAARLAPLTSLLLGLLLLVFLPVFFVILMVTVVGIPIAIMGFIAYFCALYLSQVLLGMALGRIILPKSWDTASRGYNLLAMTIGVLILGGLRMVPLPFVSGGIALLTAILALGAIAVAIRSTRRPVLPSY